LRGHPAAREDAEGAARALKIDPDLDRRHTLVIKQCKRLGRRLVCPRRDFALLAPEPYLSGPPDVGQAFLQSLSPRALSQS